jgi:putative holliday junction resolvase
MGLTAMDKLITLLRIAILVALVAVMAVDSFQIPKSTSTPFERKSFRGVFSYESSMIQSMSFQPTSSGDVDTDNEGVDSTSITNYSEERLDRTKQVNNGRIMSSNLVNALASATQSSCKILGLKSIGVDYGLVRTGIAVTVGYNPEPLVILTDLNATETCQQVVQICKSEQAKQIIVGLPLHKNGTEANQTRITRSFASDLAQHAIRTLGPNVPVYLWDERYTSKEAAARAHSRDPSRQLWGLLDAEAACIILENYYHDSGLGAERVDLEQDVKESLKALWQQQRLEDEVKVKAAMEDRDSRMERRRDTILRDRQLAIENSANDDASNKKKKKPKKKREKRGPWLVPGETTTTTTDSL